MSFTCAFLLIHVHAFAIILTLTIGGDCCSTGVLEDDANDCCLHYYNDGESCKECPAGYYGTNCSDACPKPYYGNGCIRECECSPCHHIYGCMLITTMDGIHAMPMEQMSESKVSPKTTTYEDRNVTTNSINNIGKVVIMVTGSVVTLVLLILIVREIYKYRQF